MQRTLIALVSLAASGVCYAAPEAKPRDAFKENQHRGDNGAADGNLAEAIDGWRAAFAVRPNEPDIACNIGRAEFRRNKNRDAATWLRRCLDLLPKPEDEKAHARRKAVSVELQTAREMISTLAIEITEADARVVVDEDAPWVTPIREDVFVDPGDHRIQAFKGIRTAFTTISTRAGKEYRVALALPPALPPADFFPFEPYTPPPPPEPFRWWPIAVGGGLAATGAIVGTVLIGMSGLSSNDAGSARAQIAGQGKNCVQTPTDPLCISYNQTTDRASAYTIASLVTFATVGAISAGVVGYAIYENHRVSVQIGSTSVGMKYKW